MILHKLMITAIKMDIIFHIYAHIKKIFYFVNV